MEDTTRQIGDSAVSSGAHGFDTAAESRPGVPMDAEPHPAEGAHWDDPPQQAGADRHLRRAGLEQPTSVVGTAQPPHGMSGRLRRRAYRVPEHHARHWLLLLLADRVDVVEDRIGAAMAKPLQKTGLTMAGDYVRRDPLLAIAGAALGIWLCSKLLR